MADHHPQLHHDAHGAHASVGLYWIFAVILCVITFCEWLIFKQRENFGISNTVLIAALLTLSLVKFAMVCGWYMHLRYDNKILTKIFVVAMIMSALTFLVVGVCVQH